TSLDTGTTQHHFQTTSTLLCTADDAWTSLSIVCLTILSWYYAVDLNAQNRQPLFAAFATMSDKNRSSHKSSNGNDQPPRRSNSSKSTKQTSSITTEKMKDHSKVHAHSHGSHRNANSEISRSRSKSRGRDGSAQANEQPSRSKSHSKSKSKHSQSLRQAPQDDSKSNKASSKQTNSKSTNKSPNGKNAQSKSAPSTNGNRSSASEFKSKKRAQKFATQAAKAIPASVRMISGSHDVQTSADVKNIGSSFALPDPAGRAGGACTAALLEVLYRYHEEGHEDDASWVQVLREMRSVLQQRGYEQVPQLTSSRMIDVHDPFVITPSSFNHKKNTQRAVLIGINYVNQKGQLSGCHNDVLNIAKYLRDVQGFKKENITILMDDGHHKDPTKSEIMKAYKKVVKESQDGDVVFCHYSGHGGRLRDDNGECALWKL
ncbi:hypothetical protein ACHAWX_005934, partial [Stephanocyclus meneghinianus]